MKNQPANFITTYKKRRFSPCAPTFEDVDILDIAHALSLICRANGHFNGFFSVAKHCVNCCNEGKARGFSAKRSLALLLHDASEAYISDVTRPVKLSLPDYSEIEKKLQAFIYKRFDLAPTEEDLQLIKEIDDAMLKLEFLHFANEVIEISAPEPLIKPDFKFITFEKDEEEFLELFHELYNC